MNGDNVNDLWEDMARLNMLYEELCWDHDDVLEFVPDYHPQINQSEMNSNFLGILLRIEWLSPRKKSHHHRG